MGTKAVRLNQKQIEHAKPKEKDYVLSDGDGLQLRVRTNGSRLWNFNYRQPLTKKRVNMGFGAFPELSLAQARKYTIEARSLVSQGIDPKEYREQQKLDDQKVSKHTLTNVASDWFELKKETITPNYAEDIWRSLEKHIFPKLANTPVSQITAPIIISILRPIEAKGSLETVKRLTQRLNEIMNYSVNCGLVLSNPLSGIKAAFKKPKKENMASLKPEELPELMSAIANASIKRTTRCLLEWQLHTMTRPSEASGARWDEIDLDTKIWSIPPERMKKRREHRIPLTEQALALLETMQPISGHREFVFPSDRDPLKPCNSQTANMALKRMGFAGRLVSHGLLTHDSIYKAKKIVQPEVHRTVAKSMALIETTDDFFSDVNNKLAGPIETLDIISMLDSLYKEFIGQPPLKIQKSSIVILDTFEDLFNNKTQSQIRNLLMDDEYCLIDLIKDKSSSPFFKQSISIFTCWLILERRTRLSNDWPLDSSIIQNLASSLSVSMDMY